MTNAVDAIVGLDFRPLLRAAKKATGLTWAGLAHVLGQAPRTVINWNRDHVHDDRGVPRQPNGAALRLCEILIRPSDEWGSAIEERVEEGMKIALRRPPGAPDSGAESASEIPESL